MRRIFSGEPTGARGERGQVLVLFAAGLIAFCGLVALSIDVGRIVHTRTDLQKVTDAAALAAAQDLPSTAKASAAAGTYVAANADGVEYTVSFSGPGPDTVTVTGSKTVNYTFGKVLGLDSTEPTARASAKLTKIPVTGYKWESVAPFVIWGGSREDEVNPGDQNCPLHTCVGKSYTFMDTGWMGASGNPTAPDWTANGSNNFKGDINHGAGSPVIQIGESFTTSSVGGLGNVEAPAVGSTIVIPIVNKATGNSNNRTFTIAGWALIKVDAGCKKQNCKGTLLSTTTLPPEGAVGGGSVAPPSGLTYLINEYGLID